MGVFGINRSSSISPRMFLQRILLYAQHRRARRDVIAQETLLSRQCKIRKCRCRTDSMLAATVDACQGRQLNKDEETRKENTASRRRQRESHHVNFPVSPYLCSLPGSEIRDCVLTLPVLSLAPSLRTDVGVAGREERVEQVMAANLKVTPCHPCDAMASDCATCEVPSDSEKGISRPVLLQHCGNSS
eukprot:6214481-Pleurochrysis_carterae.AAC.1